MRKIEASAKSANRSQCIQFSFNDGLLNAANKKSLRFVRCVFNFNRARYAIWCWWRKERKRAVAILFWWKLNWVNGAIRRHLDRDCWMHWMVMLEKHQYWYKSHTQMYSYSDCISVKEPNQIKKSFFVCFSIVLFSFTSFDWHYRKAIPSIALKWRYAQREKSALYHFVAL